mmetsp:Transcript_20608/g.55000  ORF Transcript_20608/g.55000 Transcript_20608/m.55000 type:complete len:541 (-) Transcript_20608:135-1757(-)
MASIPFDLSINKRHLPSAQDEVVPEEIAESMNSNFLPAAMAHTPANSTLFAQYQNQFEVTPSPFFSPVFSNFTDIQPDKIRGPGEKEQKMRRKLLRESSILIVQGGYSGKRFIYERLKELGVKVTMMDGPDSVWKTETDLFDGFITVDFSDYESVLHTAMDAIAEHGTKFDAATTYYEDAVPLAARIARALGIESNPPEACDKARNKHTTRKVMGEAGLPVPKFYSIFTEEDLRPACEVVGFPAILKPVFGLASFGVIKCGSTEEVIEKYAQVKEEMKTSTGIVWSQGTQFVLEEYYDGDEFDVDVLLSDGTVAYAKMSDNFACWEPWFQETGTLSPSAYPEDKQKEVIKLACDTALALGFKWGVFHIELKYTSRGVRLIEVNARMGGVSVWDCNKRAWGIDLVEEHAMASLKIPVCPAIPDTPLEYFGEVGINAPYSGIVTSNENWLAFAKENPIVLAIHFLKKRGDHVVGAEKGVPDWLAEIRVASKDKEEILTFLRDLVEVQLKGRVPIKPDDPKAKREFFFPSHAHPYADPVAQRD